MNEKYDIVDHMQYKNLRKRHNKMVKDILGEGYYNMGMDVYTCDEMTCDHIVDAYELRLKEINILRISVIVLVIVCLIGVIFK